MCTTLYHGENCPAGLGLSAFETHGLAGGRLSLRNSKGLKSVEVGLLREIGHHALTCSIQEKE